MKVSKTYITSNKAIIMIIKQSKTVPTFYRNHNCLDILNSVNSSITKTVFNLINNENHILNGCYLLPRTLSLRFNVAFQAELS